jgi:hypothetical protein
MSNGQISWLRVLVWSAVILLVIFLTPLGIPITMLFERKPEKVAMSGLPIVQAISDYQSDHGLLPLKLEDLVPTYLPKTPRDWMFREGCLVRQADQPHSQISFCFTGDYSNQWRFQGDSSFDRRQLNIPGPVAKSAAP